MNSGIDEMVNQLRAVAAQAAAGSSSQGTPAAQQDFAAMLQSVLADVNTTQADAKALAERFYQGDSAANLQDVVVSLQKASVSFQAMVQVRNKLVSAYQEIMNIQV